MPSGLILENPSIDSTLQPLKFLAEDSSIQVNRLCRPDIKREAPARVPGAKLKSPATRARARRTQWLRPGTRDRADYPMEGRRSSLDPSRKAIGRQHRRGWDRCRPRESRGFCGVRGAGLDSRREAHRSTPLSWPDARNSKIRPWNPRLLHQYSTFLKRSGPTGLYTFPAHKTRAKH